MRLVVYYCSLIVNHSQGIHPAPSTQRILQE
jgi:hypothetical protein